MPDKVVNGLFDFDNGNGAAISSTTYPQATVIAFKNAAAKNEVIDAFCTLGNYDGLSPAERPTKQVFFMRELRAILREKVRQARAIVIEQAKPQVDESDL